MERNEGEKRRYLGLGGLDKDSSGARKKAEDRCNLPVTLFVCVLQIKARSRVETNLLILSQGTRELLISVHNLMRSNQAAKHVLYYVCHNTQPCHVSNRVPLGNICEEHFLFLPNNVFSLLGRVLIRAATMLALFPCHSLNFLLDLILLAMDAPIFWIILYCEDLKTEVNKSIPESESSCLYALYAIRFHL